MKKILYVFSIAILLGSCLSKFTEINDQGFGGGLKANKLTIANKNINNNKTQLKISLVESKKKEILLSSEFVNSGLVDTIELTRVQSNIKKQDIKPNKTVAKLNKIFYPLMPKAVKEKFEKTIKSKSNIFGYEGDNDGMTIGFNMLMYGLIVASFGGLIYWIIFSNDPRDMAGCLPALIGFFGLFFVGLGGLIYLISLIVAYS
jgi:hypothetical protein